MTEINLPKSWSEVSYSQWQELQKIISQEWGSDLERTCEELALFLEIAPDDEIFETITLKTMSKLRSDISWIWRAKPTTPPKEIILESEKWYLQDFESMTLGEWIDLDEFSKSPQDNLDVIAAFAYRKKDEVYNYNPIKRREIFQKITIPELLGCSETIFKWRKMIIDNYTNIFEPPGWDQIEGEDQLDPEEVVQIRKEIETEKKLAPFSWLKICWSLCNEDVTKMDQVFKTPVLLVFNILSMKKALGV